MADEVVVDASVLGAALFREDDSTAAIAFLVGSPPLIAPAILTAEMVSLAAKKVWRGEATLPVAQAALVAVDDLLSDLAPCSPLAQAALQIAAAHRISAYDSLYVALASERGLRLVTLDRRLIERVQATNLPVEIGEPGRA